MKTISVLKMALATLIMATIAAVVAPLAAAANYPVVGKLGDTLEMVDTVGQVDYSWKVDGLQRSSATPLDYPVAGQVWEATATVHSVRGPVTPAISQFNAVAPNQAVYRVLWQVAGPDTISGATIPQGATATGKIYFDVTGAQPSTVTMNNGMQDLLIWQ